MSTALKTFLHEVDVRFSEIGRLISLATSLENDDQENYHAICRSCSVMIVSHVEGIVRNFAKSFIDDLNSHFKFSDLPNDLKRSHIRKIIWHDGVDSSIIEKQVSKLIEKLDLVTIPISLNSILRDGKNPSPNILNSIAAAFGINDIFSQIHESVVEKIYETDKEESINLIAEELRTILENGANSFPYIYDLKETNLVPKALPSKKYCTLSEDFLNTILITRHKIAHGESILNSESSIEIGRRLSKAKCVIYAFMITISNSVLSNIDKSNIK